MVRLKAFGPRIVRRGRDANMKEAANLSFVTYEQKGFVGVITIDRPKALNALNSEVLADLEKVIDAILPMKRAAWF